MKKLLAALVAAVFMTGLAGVALADERKADDKAQTEKPADHARMKARNANGTVKTASADSIVVTGKNAEWTFAVDDKTMIKKGGKSITAADVKPGDAVHVRFMEHDGKMVAQRVSVRAAGTAKKAENPCAAKK